MLQDLDVVQLNTALPQHGLEVGDSGTVVLVYGEGEVVEVEFMNDAGRTLCVATVRAEHLVLEVSYNPVPVAASENVTNWIGGRPSRRLRGRQSYNYMPA